VVGHPLYVHRVGVIGGCSVGGSFGNLDPNGVEEPEVLWIRGRFNQCVTLRVSEVTPRSLVTLLQPCPATHEQQLQATMIEAYTKLSVPVHTICCF
jgi:hypothetical protein